MSAEIRKDLLRLSSKAVREYDSSLVAGREDNRERTVGRKLESAPTAVRLPISYFYQVSLSSERYLIVE